MITHDEIMRQYEKLNSDHGIDLNTISQGSDDWHKVRLGVLSASNCYKFAKVGTQTCKTYLNQLVTSVVTGKPEREPVTSKQMDYGISQEIFARKDFEFQTDEKVLEYPFIFKENSYRIGVSPDGIIKSGVIEIKAPYSYSPHIDLLLTGEIKKEYFMQVQMQMMVLDCEQCTFISYDEDFTGNEMITKIIPRCEKTIERISESAEECVFLMDKMYKKMGIKFEDKFNV